MKAVLSYIIFPLLLAAAFFYSFACQDQQTDPATNKITQDYRTLPNVPKPPENFDMKFEGNVARSYLDKKTGAKITVYFDSTYKAEVTWAQLVNQQAQIDNPNDKTPESSCGGGSGNVCIRCGGKRVLCISGIPQGCTTTLESDGCMTIDCAGTGCPSYVVCCSRYFNN